MAGFPCTATYVLGEESLTTTFHAEPYVKDLLQSSDSSLRQSGSDELRKQAARELQRFFAQLQGTNFQRIRTRMRLQYSCGVR